MYYFAYGTLLVEESMRSVCPSATNKGYMRLDGYEMAFGNCSKPGLAGCTLLPKKGAVTYGIQYELTDADMAKLDQAAEVPEEQWVHLPITVTDQNGNQHASSTYIIPGEFNEWAPTEKYVAPIFAGLETSDFPADYKDFMRGLMQSAMQTNT
jgi:gamma-glutamylcyclotransferase